MEETGCEISYGAPKTLAVKGLMMMMMVMMMSERSGQNGNYGNQSYDSCEFVPPGIASRNAKTVHRQAACLKNG